MIESFADEETAKIFNGQVSRRRSITADTALRLARYFGTSATVWMRLQARYDLEVAQDQLAERIEPEVKVLSQPVQWLFLRTCDLV